MTAPYILHDDGEDLTAAEAMTRMNELEALRTKLKGRDPEYWIEAYAESQRELEALRTKYEELSAENLTVHGQRNEAINICFKMNAQFDALHATHKELRTKYEALRTAAQHHIGEDDQASYDNLAQVLKDPE